MTIETRRADPTIGIASPTRTGFAARDLRQVLLKDVDDRFVRVSETRVESGSERFTASIEVMSFISDNYAQFRLTELAESNGKLSRIRSFFKTDAPLCERFFTSQISVSSYNVVRLISFYCFSPKIAKTNFTVYDN